MKPFILLSLLLLNHVVTAQSTVDLDKKFGINKFKLESSIELYKKDLKYSITDKYGVHYYTYEVESLVKIFGKTIRETTVGFYKDKLYTINMDFLAMGNEDGDEIRRNLTSLFGYPKMAKPSIYFEWSYFWAGKKTHLGLEKSSYDSPVKPGQIAVWILSLNMKKQIELDSF